MQSAASYVILPTAFPRAAVSVSRLPKTAPPYMRGIPLPKERVDRRINVYELGADLSQMPNDSVTYEEAAHMVKHWVAKWVNKCRGIQMLQGKAPVKVRDRSCSMGPRVIFLNAAGDPAAMALAAGWRQCLKAA